MLCTISGRHSIQAEATTIFVLQQQPYVTLDWEQHQGGSIRSILPI